MRAYSASSEEALHARDLLKDWSGEDFLTHAQYQEMERETVCDLRRTNIFLRMVLFFFTLLLVGAAGGLLFVLFLEQASRQAVGAFLLISAAGSYAGAEFASSRAKLHRYGIEEALLTCSIGLLCVGMLALFFNGLASSDHRSEFLVPVAGTIASIWIWHRFGLVYAPVAAMIFVAWLSSYWTSSTSALHVIVTVFFTAGLIAVTGIRPRHRFTYLNNEYSVTEALLWLGIYLTLNLQLSQADLLARWWGVPVDTAGVSGWFYWTTFVLIWCLPPIVLLRGVRQRDRSVIVVGAVVAILTLVTNKSYLGWPRHTWDPMLLGALLIGTALFIRRWLATGPGEVRHGFTAQRLSGKDKRWLSVGTAVLGAVSPNILPTASPAKGPDAHFDGGASGGGGASSDF